jgi:hypothetical protein
MKKVPFIPTCVMGDSKFRLGFWSDVFSSLAIFPLRKLSETENYFHLPDGGYFSIEQGISASDRGSKGICERIVSHISIKSKCSRSCTNSEDFFFLTP